MSAVISTEEIMSEWHAGMHGTTFGGNPVCAAAALAVLDEYKETNILENVHQMGAYLKEKLEALKGKYSCISDIRGIGLMVAIEFSHEDGTPAGDVFAEVRDECFKNKLLTLACGVYGNGLRFATPLNVTKKEIDEGIEIIDKVLNKVWK